MPEIIVGLIGGSGERARREILKPQRSGLVGHDAIEVELSLHKAARMQCRQRIGDLRRHLRCVGRSQRTAHQQSRTRRLARPRWGDDVARNAIHTVIEHDR